MEKEKTLDCLCIKSIDYKENDKLVTLYAFGEGKITASLRGVKKPKARLKYAQALLCFGKYYLTGKNGYYNVIGCDLVDSFYGIWTNIDKYYASLCSLEILDKVADDREVGDTLAVMTLDFLNEICYKTNNIFFSFAVFLSKVVKLLGYNLSPICCNCGEDNLNSLYYSFLKCGIVCKNCRESNAMPLSENATKLICDILDGNYINNVNCNQEDFVSVIRIYFDVICKNLAKKFKTFEEYLIFYNLINK